MAKKALCVLLTLLTAVYLLPSCCTVFAEKIPEGTSQAGSSATVSEAADPSGTTAPVTVSLAEYPVLSVSAISNYFGRIDAEYNEFTREITVVYMLKSSKRLLSTDWTLTYDTALLTVDPKKNTPETICPVMQPDAVMAFDAEKGRIHCCATDLRMFDFSTGAAPFVQIVFDVAPLTVKDSEITKVDLSVNDLIVSEPNPQTAEAVPEKEVVLVANGKVRKDAATKTVQTSKYTTITPSTFEEPNRDPASKDQVTTTLPPTTVPPTVAGTPAVTQPKTEPQPQVKPTQLETGTWYMALLILLILLGCSTALFVMRKRDIYNS